MGTKGKFVWSGFEVEVDMLELIKTVDKEFKSAGLNSQEDTKLQAIGVMLICEGIKIGTIAEHKKMQDAYGEAIPLIMKCADFVELIQKIELGLSIPQGKA